MRRRDFLKFSAYGAGASLLPGSSLLMAAEASTELNTLLIFLRGGADGLNMVVPYTESEYYAQRPDINIPPPGAGGGALKLDVQQIFPDYPGGSSLGLFA